MAYIEKELLMNKFEDLKAKSETLRDMVYLDGVLAVIESIPAADVEEVKRGEWIDNFVELTTLGGNGIPKEYVCGYKCSLCGRKELQKESYCNCGAKMDGRRDM